jgi:polyketide synthase PksN
MDPQERIFMEACWGALEDAGYTREQLKVQFGGKVGVFAGITKMDITYMALNSGRMERSCFPILLSVP